MACELKNNTNQPKIRLAMPSLIAITDDVDNEDAYDHCDDGDKMAIELYTEYMVTHDDLLTATVRGDAPETIREMSYELDAKGRNVQRCARLLNNERKKRFEAARESVDRIIRVRTACRDVYANGYNVRIINQALC